MSTAEVVWAVGGAFKNCQSRFTSHLYLVSVVWVQNRDFFLKSLNRFIID